jgi:hypothetical protein
MICNDIKPFRSYGVVAGLVPATPVITLGAR